MTSATSLRLSIFLVAERSQRGHKLCGTGLKTKSIFRERKTILTCDPSIYIMNHPNSQVYCIKAGLKLGICEKYKDMFRFSQVSFWLTNMNYNMPILQRESCNVLRFNHSGYGKQVLKT